MMKNTSNFNSNKTINWYKGWNSFEKADLKRVQSKQKMKYFKDLKNENKNKRERNYNS